MAAACVGSGLLGAIAGNVCHRYRIQPLIVTLAMGTIAVGIVQVQDGGTATGSAQAWLATLAEPVTNTFGVGIPPIVAILVVVASSSGSSSSARRRGAASSPPGPTSARPSTRSSTRAGCGR